MIQILYQVWLIDNINGFIGMCLTSFMHTQTIIAIMNGYLYCNDGLFFILLLTKRGKSDKHNQGSKNIL